MRLRFLLFVSVMAAFRLQSEVVYKIVEYREGNTVLEGLSVYDDSVAGKRPGVLVVHQWKGLGEYEKKRAEMLAGLGYNVFAADIYGKGVRHQDAKDAAAEAGKYKEDRALLRAGPKRAGSSQTRQADGFTTHRGDWLLLRRNDRFGIGQEWR
jgi:dienelactone hydrolase